MPTYAYACPKCGHEYEKLQKMSDETRAKCPECGTRGERLISGGVGLVFKGSGFYITDYKRAGETKRDGEGAEKSAGKDDGKPKKSSSKDSTSSSTSSKGKGADS
jgi:putative FmdB family regulatory protein